MSSPSVTQATRRRQRSTRVSVAIGLLLLAALGVSGAVFAVQSAGASWLLLAGAAVLLNLSASNVVIGKAAERETLCASQSMRCQAAYVYSAAGPGESTTDLAWDGQATIHELGALLASTARFPMGRQMAVADVDVQRIRLEDGRTLVSEPVDGGDPHDATILRTLAEAMQQQPMGVTKVARKDRGGTFGEDLFLPPEQGRVVVDAGTLKTLHERVVGIAGQALYVPRSPEAGRLAVEAGLPRACLVEAGAWPVPPVSG